VDWSGVNLIAFVLDTQSGTTWQLFSFDPRRPEEPGRVIGPLLDGAPEQALLISTTGLNATDGALAEAQTILTSYFALLNERRYAEATHLYGGDYEQLRDWNPSVSPADVAALFQNGCEVNGLQCLELERATLESRPNPSELRFRVTFRNPDGTRFERGPCCGADATTQPPQDTFIYTVIKTELGYQVLELPPYVP
jgi:hypothetical protein